MTYSAAIQWREGHLNLIGTTDKKGFVVSDLIIVPTNPQNRDVFLKNYLFAGQRETAIIPYIGKDVQVWSVDLGRVETHNILFYNILVE
ncbi:MAG: hypothetical protein K6E73_07120 [Bacteroidales bacterium]|nr:hypothetical protein [Bacteroidales bacterium]